MVFAGLRVSDFTLRVKGSISPFSFSGSIPDADSTGFSAEGVSIPPGIASGW
jgi:hypothetical protein